ncbi:GntR family transcriptional regulator [Microbacterium halophytorum]|uniref:GntR family transcriptional regulator n=1 Tax=Microbacterium halophytorum TaxID=2067568 RepID=UPI001319EDAC|nr:GntR family transcriptional regulator [Microbacterium halophytorum]
MPNKTGPLEQDSQRLADAVYERLGEAIIDGTLEPGARIRDQEIASDLGVSRMPVREALQRLERIGLVEMSASRFTRITEVSDKDVDDSIEYLGYQAAAAIRMATPRMNDAQRERAAALARAVIASTDGADPESADDVQRIFQAYNSLWSHLAVCSGNLVFSRTYTEAWYALERAYRDQSKLSHPLDVIRDTAEQIARAIEEQDTDEAERIVRRIFFIAD